MTSILATPLGLVAFALSVADTPAAHTNLESAASETALFEWTFDRPGDLQGWTPNAHLQEVRVTNGVLSARAVGHDPMFVLDAPLGLRASPWQWIELRLKADRDGECEWFWSNTTQGPYGGFTQAKTTRFNVRGDGQWRTYRVLPFWHSEGKIIRLRLDVYDGTDFDLDAIRIIELAPPPRTARATFEFPRDTPQWRAIGRADLNAGADGLETHFADADGFLLAPAVTVNADEATFLSVQMTAEQGDHGTILFATEEQHGLHRLTFPIRADGHDRRYNVDLLAAANWRGRVVALGFRPTEVPGARTQLRRLEVSATPQGAPQLEVIRFALEEALPRAGRSSKLIALLSNTGGESASQVRCRIQLPAGVHLIRAEASAASALAFDERLEWSWEIVAAAPTTGTATLQVSAANAPGIEASTPLTFSEQPNVPKADYVPEPNPVRGRTEVGVYYFPGWNSWGQWQPIRSYPERKPVLGWYREGDPEVADWQIKWAVEHGITFFVYDWYWSQGARQLEHALHDGFFQARYRHLLKFCLLWANHNPPQTSSLEDCLAVTRFWIEHYFRQPEYVSWDGQPVVIIFSPDRLTSDLGTPNVKLALEAMRKECRKTGFNGLYLIACVADAGQARHAADAGYDAVTAYTWPGLGLAAGEKRGSYATLIEGYRRNWQQIRDRASIPLLLPICGGWDSRPWHGHDHLVRYGRTPELFKRHLLDAQALLPATPASPVANAILIEAWNEWGEGSYVEPHQEFGFGYLDAIREVFADTPSAHIHLSPADVGLGPYELPGPPHSTTAWEFERDDEGWGSTMQMTEVSAIGGRLIGRTSGNDPAFFGPPMQAQASEWSGAVVRMKLQAADGQPFTDSAQLFWRIRGLPETEASSVRFRVAGNGEWQDYRLSLAGNRRWRGVVTRLRIDPCTRPGVTVELDAIRLTR